MSSDLSGKVAIVTGSSSGLGEATAVHLAKRGASVTLCGRNEERLEAVKQTCVQVSGGKTGQFLTVCGDMGRTEVRNKTVDQTVAKFGHLDIVVANHGELVLQDNFESITEKKFDTMISSNVKSILFLLQRASPHLIKSKGSIVTISTALAVKCAPALLAYSMSKAALDYMTRTLSINLGPKGVRVNNLRPGLCVTRIGRDHRLDFIDDAFQGSIPARRFGVGNDVATTVGFLVSDEAKYITGADIDVDGGVRNISAFAPN